MLSMYKKCICNGRKNIWNKITLCNHFSLQHLNDDQHTITPTTNFTPEHRIPFEFTGDSNEYFSIDKIR